MSPTAREPARWSMHSTCPSLEPSGSSYVAACYVGRYIGMERAHTGDHTALVPLPSVPWTRGNLRPCLFTSLFAYLGSRPHVCAYRIHLLATMPLSGRCFFRSCLHACRTLHKPGVMLYPAPDCKCWDRNGLAGPTCYGRRVACCLAGQRFPRPDL